MPTSRVTPTPKRTLETAISNAMSLLKGARLVRGAWQKVARPEVELRQQRRSDGLVAARRTGQDKPHARESIDLDGHAIRIDQPVLLDTMAREQSQLAPT